MSIFIRKTNLNPQFHTSMIYFIVEFYYAKFPHFFKIKPNFTSFKSVNIYICLLIDITNLITWNSSIRHRLPQFHWCDFPHSPYAVHLSLMIGPQSLQFPTKCWNCVDGDGYSHDLALIPDRFKHGEVTWSHLPMLETIWDQSQIMTVAITINTVSTFFRLLYWLANYCWFFPKFIFQNYNCFVSSWSIPATKIKIIRKK